MVRRTSWLAVAALTGGLALGLSGCAGPEGPVARQGVQGEAPDDGLVTVGFVAVGPEGAWREANERDLQETLTQESGFDLRYAPATDRDQASQIAAFTSFVDERVDIILLSATDGAGWEAPLRQAVAAEVPVILIDRGIEPDDPSLYVTRIAPDNVVVAQGVAQWAVSAFPDGANYFTLEGPPGVGVVNERNLGWDSVMAEHPGFVEVGEQTANWSTEEARAVVAAALQAAGNDIQLVVAQNDEMGLGAALAVEEAGLTPGVDVKITTIDGTLNALTALAEGRLSFVAEYNPLFGQTALEVVTWVLEGKSIDPYLIVPSGTFDSPEAARAVLGTRRY